MLSDFLKVSVSRLKKNKANITPINSKRFGPVSGIAISYTCFLLICLILLALIGFSYDARVRDHYWEQQSDHLVRATSSFETDIQLMTDYARQLRTDYTLLALAQQTDETDRDYVFATYRVMQNLTVRQYGLLSLPVARTYLYLQSSNHVLTASESTSADLYYRSSRSFPVANYDQWLHMLKTASADPTFVDYTVFSKNEEDYALLLGLSGLQKPDFPLVVVFELDMDDLKTQLLPQHAGNDCALYILDAQGTPIFQLGKTTSGRFSFSSLSFDKRHIAYQDDYCFLRRQVDSGRQYLLVLPKGLANEEVASFGAAFVTIFFVALVVGCLVIMLLIRRAKRPIERLTSQLGEATDANAQLQSEIDAQRPMLLSAYLRKLLSGHVASQEEFAYMMDSLKLTGDIHHYVLFCVANRQDATTNDPNAEADIITSALEHHLSGSYPLYYYMTLAREFVVLVTYPNSEAESLNDLQHRIVQLHDDLADQAGLWFYAGVGGRCVEPSKLWESYEQARAASRYTAKHHIFLPYEFIRKDTQSWYYPIEISAKLLHFITTGNKAQTTEMFALIHRENIEQRSLPMPLLNMLLSDLKNTLFKARFQIPQSTQPELIEKLNRLDELLYAPAPSFAQLEDNALLLCDFFVKATSPASPVPDVERYLQENYTDPSLCLSKVGERFNISDTYLSHMFKEKTGQNFSVYLERLRMNEAARRLSSGDCNLSELYADLGYTNATSFRRAFKKFFGMTPSEMRNQPKPPENDAE